MEEFKDKLSGQNIEIIIKNQPIKDSNYSLKEEKLLIFMKRSGSTDAKIADRLKRSYWGVVDKVRRLRMMGKI